MMQAQSCVFYEVCDGRPGTDIFEPGWGQFPDLESAIAKLQEIRVDFPAAYLAKVSYERCPAPALMH